MQNNILCPLGLLFCFVCSRCLLLFDYLVCKLVLRIENFIILVSEKDALCGYRKTRVCECKACLIFHYLLIFHYFSIIFPIIFLLSIIITFRRFASTRSSLPLISTELSLHVAWQSFFGSLYNILVNSVARESSISYLQGIWDRRKKSRLVSN